MSYNSSYHENAQKMSIKFRDQPEKPLNRAIWWVEYILRNPRPDHLQSPAKKIGKFAAESYDVVLFLVTLLFVCIWTIFKLVTKIFTGNNKVKIE